MLAVDRNSKRRAFFGKKGFRRTVYHRFEPVDSEPEADQTEPVAQDAVTELSDGENVSVEPAEVGTAGSDVLSAMESANVEEQSATPVAEPVADATPTVVEPKKARKPYTRRGSPAVQGASAAGSGSNQADVRSVTRRRG